MNASETPSGKWYYGKLMTNLEREETEEWEVAERYIRIEGDAVIIYRPDTKITTILPLSKYKISIDESKGYYCNNISEREVRLLY